MPAYAVIQIKAKAGETGRIFGAVTALQISDGLKALGFDAALVDRTLKMVNTNEYKRNQFCPIIRISPKAFGVGRRMPIVGKYLN